MIISILSIIYKISLNLVEMSIYRRDFHKVRAYFALNLVEMLIKKRDFHKVYALFVIFALKINMIIICW